MTRAWSLDSGRAGFTSRLFSLWPKGSCDSQLWAPHLENRASAIPRIKWEEEADCGDIGWVLTMCQASFYTQGN